MKPRPIDSKSVEKIKLSYRLAKKRLILIDFDGTLVPIADSPEVVYLNERAKELIERYTCDLRNKIVIVSGREREFLETRFDSLSVTLIAEHGYFIREPGEDWCSNDFVNMNWQSEVMPIMKEYTRLCPGAMLEKKQASLAWHYRNIRNPDSNPRINELRHHLSELISRDPTLKILEGIRVLEIKSVLYDKGTAVSRFIAEGNYDFIMAIGDDITDEDLFRVIPCHGFTIKIGPSATSALYNIKDQTEIYDLLSDLSLG